MVLDLSNVFANTGEKKAESFLVDLSDLEYSGGYPFVSPVKVRASAENNAGIVTLELYAEFDYTAPCDRCFETVTRRYNLRFFHKLIKKLEEEYNDDFIETPDMKVDIDELVLSDVLLELPSKFLCREDCQGLCPQCGKNLNLGNCGCSNTQVDPRLEKLKELL